MGRFLDLLTGRLYNFSNVKGKDINAGTSDTLIITPKALSQSDVFCNTSIPMVLPSVFKSKSMLFDIQPNLFVVPNNSCFFPNRGKKVKAQLFPFAKADVGVTGEICVIDVAKQSVVASSASQFKNNSFDCVKTDNTFELEAGKCYAVAIRRVSAKPIGYVYLKAVTLTLQFLAT